jgi:tetratricopeptide (TPR) repeat protein
MTVAINHILNKLNRDYYLGRLYNLLGDQYLVSGDIHKAIECNQESGAIAAECLKSTALETDRVKFDELRKTAISNMGLCKMALGETTEAIEHFEEAASFNRNAVYYLAFLYSCIGDLEQASKYVLASENLLLEYQKDSSSLPHISWYMALLCLNMGLTYRELGEFEKAKAACLQALAHSNDSHRQLRAKIINALAEIYREQGNLEKALESHHQAIEISNEIGAKCELAESHHQLGITYQMQQDVEKSDENFRAAIQLFSQMKAPKQVERVKRSMEANINN